MKSDYHPDDHFIMIITPTTYIELNDRGDLLFQLQAVKTAYY